MPAVLASSCALSGDIFSSLLIWAYALSRVSCGRALRYSMNDSRDVPPTGTIRSSSEFDRIVSCKAISSTVGALPFSDTNRPHLVFITRMVDVLYGSDTFSVLGFGFGVA